MFVFGFFFFFLSFRLQINTSSVFDDSQVSKYCNIPDLMSNAVVDRPIDITLS
jgi:hypothetical protein